MRPEPELPFAGAIAALEIYNVPNPPEEEFPEKMRKLLMEEHKRLVHLDDDEE